MTRYLLCMQDGTFDRMSFLWGVSKSTVRDTVTDILFHELLFNPHRPIFLNQINLTDDQLNVWFDSHRVQQTAGVQKIEQAARDPKGREVLVASIDAFHTPCPKSADSNLQVSETLLLWKKKKKI